MSKKKKSELKTSYIERKHRTEDIVDTLKDNYMPYAMSVIVSRAIPQIDGFKPSHRKLLYTMYKMNLLRGNRTKSANIVGQTMKLNPHGDMAIYETLVRLSRGNETLLHPYVDSKGNFGKASSRDMQFAASRYTEARLMPICKELFSEIEQDTVDFVDNYDSTMKEPTLLPTTFPNILVKSNKGIAVGMASSIPSFNLKEVCEYTIAYLKNKNCDVFQYILGPDLPSGGELLFDKEELQAIYESGKGSFRIRGRYRYLQSEAIIEIYEIPYTATIEAIVEKIVELMKNGRLKEVTDVRDESDLNGLKITLDVKKNIHPEELMAKLFRYTPLEDAYSCNFNILINDTPKVLGISQIIGEWLNFRRNCVLKSIAHEIDSKFERLFLLRGLEKIVLDIDKAIAIIRHTEKESDVLQNLIHAFDIDAAQGEYILEIKLRNLNKEYILKKTQEIESLEKELKKLNEIYTIKELQDELMISQLRTVIKEYGQERKTGIVQKQEVILHAEEEKVEEYPLTVFLTKQGYMKKIPETSLRAYSEQKLKDGDEILQQMDLNNKDIVLLLSDKNVMYQIRLSEMEDTKASVLGVFLTNYLETEEEEKFLQLITPNDYQGFMIYVFENGKIAKIPLASYETKGFRKKLLNAYSDKSKLIDVFYMQEDLNLLICTQEGKYLSIHTSLLAPIGSRNSQGVQVLRLTKKDHVISACVLDEEDLLQWEFCKTKKIPLAPKRKDGKVKENVQISFV